MIRVFGIRHHGPGSARRLLHAFEEWQPDRVLIELPADAEKELIFARDPDLVPPLAIVSYNPKNLQEASYYPFASFSPEWQAIRWALEREVPVVAIDLPTRISLALRKEPDSPQLLLTEPENPVPAKLLFDPLGYLAQLAGEPDGERWWEITFEKVGEDVEVFPAIIDLMDTLRQELRGREPVETLRREAYMRQAIRKVIKEGTERIAVVCGAWHAPVLDQLEKYKASSDAKMLRGLPKVKVQSTWIPWSYERLSKAAGYGAGVNSPAWYSLLFEQGSKAAAHWMVGAARLLREEGFDVSPAHAEAAVRLANNLTALRGQSVPGLDELQEAALVTLAAGQAERLQLIKQKLVLGSKVGIVPEGIPAVPLQADVMALIKKARLTKYWGEIGKIYLKATKTQPRGGIDLREPNDLLKSQLLHQFDLLQLNWGTSLSDSDQALGSFKEIWQLNWKPELNLYLLEAARYGPTLGEASRAKVLERAAEVDSLKKLAQLTLDSLRAGLADLVPVLSQQLQSMAALTEDTAFLLSALPELVNIIRYGDSRKTDTTALALLVAEMTPRISIGLPATLSGIDADVALFHLEEILAAHSAYANLAVEELSEQWHSCLERLSRTPAVHALIQGLSTRLLLDIGQLSEDIAVQRFRYALSAANGPADIAYYLEGFLSGSGLLLLYHPLLLRLVDEWLLSLGPDSFQTVLPLLRRTFSRFSGPERQKLLAKIGQGVDVPVAPSSLETASSKTEEEPIAETVLATLQNWLGKV